MKWIVTFTDGREYEIVDSPILAALKEARVKDTPKSIELQLQSGQTYAVNCQTGHFGVNGTEVHIEETASIDHLRPLASITKQSNGDQVRTIGYKLGIQGVCDGKHFMSYMDINAISGEWKLKQTQPDRFTDEQGIE